MTQRWYQKAAVQTGMVTGVLAIAATLIATLVPTCSRISTLETQSEQLKLGIDRLSDQLIPFKTIALDRYPGGEAEALARLADDLRAVQSRLDQALGVIRSFEVDVAAVVAAKWSSGSPPKISGFLSLGGDADSYLDLRLNTGETRRVELHGSRSPTVSPVDQASSRIEYRAAARSGD